MTYPARANLVKPFPDGGIAADLRSFRPVGIAAMLVILAGNLILVPLSAILVLVWARWSRTPWHEIGYVRCTNWSGSMLLGITFGCGLKLLLKIIIMPLLGAPPINQAFHYLVGNQAAIPATLYLIIAGAGFGEETVFRGYLFERLGKLFGGGRRARIWIVLLTSVLFGAAHYSSQGIAGVEQATLVGLVFGSVFAATGRIWMLMWAHAAFDLTAYAIIYWGLETRFAHLVFP